MTKVLRVEPADSRSMLLLAHGAGAPMTSPFLETFADLMAARGIATGRFEFAYMAGRKPGTDRPVPPRAELLQPEYIAAVEGVLAARRPPRQLFIGGKSMGGRVASLVAGKLYQARRIAGLICLGYPFHPPDKPAQMRTAHLMDLRVPTLIVQGERDPFGTRSEVERLGLPQTIAIHWVTDGDHDLKAPRRSSASGPGSLEVAADAVARFMRTRALQAR
jgi:predicted alpha/beta-hydrolase family hydrolase